MKRQLRECVPGSLASIYLKPGIYRVRFAAKWAYFYGQSDKVVWDCNEEFARHHTVSVRPPKKAKK